MPDKVIGRKMNMLVHTQRNAVCLRWGRVGGGNMVHASRKQRKLNASTQAALSFSPSYSFQDSSSQSSGANMVCSLKSSPAEAQNGFVPFIWLMGAPCSMLKLILEWESEAIPQEPIAGGSYASHQHPLMLICKCQRELKAKATSGQWEGWWCKGPEWRCSVYQMIYSCTFCH